MATLYDKVMHMYPDLKEEDFLSVIILQNDSDGNSDYIASWNHSTYPRPTEEQLAALENVLTYVKPEPTPQEKLQAAGLTVTELKTLLGL